MKTLKECNLSEIVVELQAGKTLIFPTETSYGLGCDATSQQAVDEIFKIKGRDESKSLLIVVPTIEMAQKYLMWNSTIEKLANKYWPGPLTIVGNYKPDSGLAQGVVAKNNTVAVRVSTYPIVKFLTESLGKAIVATSGNVAGAGDIYNAKNAVAMFSGRANQPDIILDFGQLPKNLPTTILDATGDKINILRQGELKITDA
jgi:L-threonylcarbamoyladenylate synthase